MADYNTFVKDLRPFGGGSVIEYGYLKSDLAGTEDDLEQGEMGAFETSSGHVVRFVRDGSAGKFTGMTKDSARAVHKLGNQAGLNLDRVGVYSTGVHMLVGTGGETYNHGDAVYMNGTDTTKVTKTAAGGVQVGTVHNPTKATYSGAVRVPILIDEFTVVQA